MNLKNRVGQNIAELKIIVVSMTEDSEARGTTLRILSTRIKDDGSSLTTTARSSRVSIPGLDRVTPPTLEIGKCQRTTSKQL